MGATQSFLSTEAAVTVVVAAGALGLGYTFRGGATAQQPPAIAEPQKGDGSKKKKKKKAATEPKQETGDTSTTRPESSNVQVVAFPDVIPGQFDSPDAPGGLGESSASISSKAKKGKKKKGKAQGTDTPALAQSVELQPEPTPAKPTKSKPQKPASKSSNFDAAASLSQSFASVDTDGSWTRVDSRRGHRFEVSTSDAGITTSVTGNSSPVAERTEDDSFAPNPRDSGENRRTLAEKLLPKARKTGVEDLLKKPDVPTLSRVMRITPGPDEKPASGFSWGDYEDVRATDGGENDADGEDDGWVVKSRRSKPDRQGSSSTPQPAVSKSSTPEPRTKKQRQNDKRKQAQSAAKAAAEEERLAALARHKRELARLHGVDQSKKTSGKTLSGGMNASLDENSKLVWT